MDLIPIGQFSKSTRLSVKALRLYDEIGLIRPAHVDPDSGYRYYEKGQANKAGAIRILRSVEMPLDEIRAVLDADDPDLVHKHLTIHRERLAERLEAQERMIAYLESLINDEETLMPYEITIETVQPQTMMATKIHTTLETVGDDFGTAFGLLGQTLGETGIQPSGAPVSVYHDVIDEETSGEVEIGIPIAVQFEDDGQVYRRELEGGPVATTTHKGPYQEIAPAYHAVTTWISENGHEMAGPPREFYLNDPQSVAQEELLTRVEFPLVAAGE